MCPLLSSLARARAAHPLCLQFVTSEIFIGPRIFDKKNKELNTRLHQFPYLWVRTGQTEWPLKLPHDSDKK